MLARAAERNPSVFLPSGPVCTIKQIVPKLLNIAEYTNNPWGNTKFLLSQFKPSAPPISTLSKWQRKEAQEAVAKAKSLPEVAEKLNVELGKGKEVMTEIEARIRERPDADVWTVRQKVEEKGEAVDEPVSTESRAEDDGWEVGVGPAAAAHA
jgi:tRNA-dihydrouridine synthase 2